MSPNNIRICNEADIYDGTFVKCGQVSDNVWCLIFKNQVTHSRYYINYNIATNTIENASTKTPVFKENCSLNQTQIINLTERVKTILSREMIVQQLFGK